MSASEREAEESKPAAEPGDNSEVGVRPNRGQGLVPEQGDDEWSESDHVGKDVS
ncbi:MAG: hypothetical protein JWL70_828 [Acidimicrobiia bacterium]|nr:hypothetical protein [Acidimicrobiia bacterium]